MALRGSHALGAPAVSAAGRGGSPDVVVIGAGLAGLTAARALMAEGASVVVLEARDRPGGRIYTQQLPGGWVIDLGAQFMGDAQTHVAALANDAGLRRIPAEIRGDMLHLPREDGVPMRGPRDALPLPMIHRLDALQAGWRLERSVASLEPGDMARLDGIDAAAFIRGKTVLDPTFRAIAGHIEGELCTALSEVSAYEVLEQGASIGGFAAEGASAQWFLAEGAQGMSDYLAGAVGGSLVLNAPVSRVAQEAGAVTVTAATGTYRAGRAVVAAPPQLYGRIGLLEDLPPAWRDALSGWRAGSVVKTILVFREPWWRRSGLLGAVSGPGGMFGAALDGSRGDGAGILVIFSTGRGAEALQRVPEEAGRIAAALRWLGQVHGGVVPEPVAARSVDWSTEPFSLGGYASRRGIGGWSAAPDLFTPLGRLHFAGTETATRWRSFMEGAVQSGLRAAGEVLAAGASAARSA